MGWGVEEERTEKGEWQELRSSLRCGLAPATVPDVGDDNTVAGDPEAKGHTPASGPQVYDLSQLQ